MASNKLFDYLIVDGYKDRWYICWPDGDHYDGQIYKRAQDAKCALTKMRNL